MGYAVLLLLVFPGEKSHYDCGTRALYTAIRLRGVACTPADVAQAIAAAAPTGQRDTLAALGGAAERLGLVPLAVHYSSKSSPSLPRGAVIHIQTRGGTHFLTYLGAVRDGVVLADAPVPPFVLSRENFVDDWSGSALLLFDSSSDAQFFESTARRSKLRLWTTAALAAGCAAVVALRLTGRPLVRRFTSCLVLSLAAATSSCGCSSHAPGQRHIEFPCELMSPPPIDAGFVPPHGKDLQVGIANPTSRDVVLNEDARPTCGCTKVIVPSFVPAKGTATLMLELQGQQEPLERFTSFVLQTSEGAKLPVSVRFVTGDLPCVTPYVVELSRWTNGGVEGAGVLWFDAPQPCRASVKSAGESSLELEVVDGEGYENAGRNIVNVSRPGLVAVRFRARPRKNAASLPQLGQSSVSLSYAGQTHCTTFLCALPEQAILVVNPGRVTFLRDDRLIGRARVAILRSPRPGSCRVISHPSHLTAEIESLSTYWKLVIRPSATTELSPRIDDVVVRHQSTTGDVAEGVCQVEVRGN